MVPHRVIYQENRRLGHLDTWHTKLSEHIFHLAIVLRIACHCAETIGVFIMFYAKNAKGFFAISKYT